MKNQQMLTQADVASTLSSGPAQRFDYYLPPGYHFVPTDEELITDYLARKDKGLPIAVKDMHEVDLYKFCPRYLTEHYAELGNEEWYFFTSRARKYPNGNRPSRSVESKGFWKATGADKGIYSSTGELIGTKKVLVFYDGKPKSEEQKTNWIMHEYKLNKPSRKPGGNDMKLDDIVLCQLHQQSGKSTKKRKRLAQAPLAEKPESPNDDQVAHGYGNIIIAPPLTENNEMAPPLTENNEMAAGGSQEAAPIDYSHQFPGSYEMCDNLASMFMMADGAGWNNSLHHDSMGEMIYSQNNNIDYGVPSYPFNVQQQQLAPNPQQDSYVGNSYVGNSFEQDFSNFINGYNQNFPEPENGFAGHGGQGDRTAGMGGQGDVSARRIVG